MAYIVVQQFEAVYPQHLSEYSGLLLCCLSNKLVELATRASKSMTSILKWHVSELLSELRLQCCAHSVLPASSSMTILPHYLLKAVIHMDNQLEDNVLDVSVVFLEKACIAQ